MRSTLFLYFIFYLNITAQLYNITGKIIDEKNGEPLIGVNIIIDELKIGTSSNDEGIFIFNEIKKGTYTISFSYLGHKTVYKTIDVPIHNELIIEMREGSVDIGEIIVTGNPFSTDTKNISQSTLSIANLDLQILRSSTIGQILNYQPGISMRSNGISTSRPVIRGFSNNRVLILENGLRMGDLSNTSDDHGVSSDGSSPEKIEVLRGPASLLYGSNALGGVINIITESIPTYVPDGIDGNISLSKNTVNGEFTGSTDIHYGINNFAFHGNLFRRDANNYFDGYGLEVSNSDYNSSGFQFGLSFIPSEVMSGLSYSNYTTNYGIPYYTINHENMDDEGPINIKMKKNEIRLQIQFPKFETFIKSVSLKAGYQNYSHEEILKSTGEIGTSFGLKTISVDLSLNHEPFLENTKGIFGFYLFNQRYSVIGEEAFTPNAKYFGFAAYFFEQIELSKFIIQLGGRYEYNSVEIPEAMLSDFFFDAEKKNYYSLSGSIGLVFNLTDQISFFSNIANAFRSPTIEELSSYAVHGATASFDIGDRNLINEKNFGFDIGFRLRKYHHLVELSAYYNILNDFIFRIPTGIFYSPELQIQFNSSNGFPVYRYIQSKAKIFGFELKAQYELTRFFSATIVMDYVNGKQADYKYLPQIPPFRFSLEPRYSDDNFWIGLSWKLAAQQNNTAQFETITKGYGIIDIYIGTKYTSGNNIHIINFKAENLLEQKYRDHLSATKDFALMPGRNFRLSYKFLF